MGEFKPMVKMETTEPSVELKLKKGGSVAHKKMKGDASTGHKSGTKMADGGMMGALSALPSLVKGPVAPVQRARVPARPSLAARRAAMTTRPTMKHGGKAEGKKNVAFLEKKGAPKEMVKEEKKEHGLKKGGKCYKTGGVVLGNGGGYKTGGVIKGNGGGYATGGVALGNAGGFKKGGSSKKAFASGGSVNNEGKATSMPQGAKKPSSPVSINQLSGTFKKGGNVSSKKLQKTFTKENAPALNASKAKLLDKYSPYQKADGGSISDSDYAATLRAEKSGKKTMVAPNQGSVTVKERQVTTAPVKRYPSGLSDADIDRILNSATMQERLSHDIDKKRGGKVKK